MIDQLVSLAMTFTLVGSVYAATSTATPAADTKLENLKDRLASAATQLKQSQKRAIAGTVKVTSVSTITVGTKTKDIKIELSDNVKVIEMITGKRTTLDTDKITKGDVVVVFGDYDANVDILKASVIFIQDEFPTRISGKITETSKKDYTISVTTPEGKSYIVDIETTTKNNVWSKSAGITKSAFSKLVVGDTVHVLGTAEKKEGRISAIRVLDIGPSAQAGNLSGVTPTPTPTATASPSATPKP